MSDDATLEQLATGRGYTNFKHVDSMLAREIIALRTRAEGRLDSHNRIMESIVRRVRVLEQQARPEQEDGHLAVADGDGDAIDWLESRRATWQARAEMAEQRQETAERERDEALQHVEQLKFFNQANFDEATKARNERDAARASAERLKPYARHFASCSRDATMNAPCTCGLTAALEDA